MFFQGKPLWRIKKQLPHLLLVHSHCVGEDWVGKETDTSAIGEQRGHIAMSLVQPSTEPANCPVWGSGKGANNCIHLGFWGKKDPNAKPEEGTKLEEWFCYLPGGEFSQEVAEIKMNSNGSGEETLADRKDLTTAQLGHSSLHKRTMEEGAGERCCLLASQASSSPVNNVFLSLIFRSFCIWILILPLQIQLRTIFITISNHRLVDGVTTWEKVLSIFP